MKKIFTKIFTVLLTLMLLMLALIPSSVAACTNHKWMTERTISPTCIADGRAVQRCVTCGITKTTVLKSHGHNWVAATCTSPKKCARCGMTSGNALGHTFSPATCTSPKKCLRCGITQGTAPQHSWAPATCTEPRKCRRCGRPSGEPLGHSWSAWITVKNPTSVTQGVKKRTCNRCGIEQTATY